MSVENKHTDRIFLTPAQAISLLSKGKQIHTFRSTGSILMGADWSRVKLIEALNENSDRIEIGGEQCKATGHGLVVWTSENNPLFIEADKQKLEALEKELTEKATQS